MPRFPLAPAAALALSLALSLALAPAPPAFAQTEAQPGDQTEAQPETPPAAQSGSLCARGASAGPVPLSHLFETDLATLREAAWNRVDWSDPALEGRLYAYPEAEHMARIFADRAASLPPALRDLPYLLLLVEAETYPDSALFILTHGAESHMVARILDAMDRAGLKAEGALLREAIGLYPDWGNHPADRAAQLFAPSGEIADQALFDALTDLSFRWPPPTGAAAAAAEALIAADPGIARDYTGRLALLTPEQRLDWLMSRLWAECLGPYDTPDQADAAFFRGGSVQGALLVMDIFRLDVEDYGGAIDSWFYGYGATMAPQLATLLDRRGLVAEAAALREAMALFGTPYPRDTWERQGLIEGMTAAQIDALNAIGARIDTARITAEMLVMARDSGLLPD